VHDTVAKLRKHVRQNEPDEGGAQVFSARLQAGDLTRALTEPLSTHLELLYVTAYRWVRHALELEDSPSRAGLAGLLAESQILREVLEDLLPFLERAEDILSEREEVTHRESGYEREIAPFSRLDSTAPFRTYLEGNPAFGAERAAEGAQLLGDLMKVVYLKRRLDEGMPKPADLYAIAAELLLDTRRHLFPHLEEGSPFLRSLRRAAESSR
jgi:hypothetical protein